MHQLTRHGVNLRFEDVGKGAPPLVLIHDLACDHASFAPQLEHFRFSHRVVAVDLRGHGQSDKPEQEYTVASFADDIAWLCYELGIYSPIVVGHGLGGVIGMELAARYPDLPAALVALDSPIVPPPETRDFLRSFSERLGTPACHDALRDLVASLFPSTAIPRHRDRVLESVSTVSQQTVASAWEDALKWDGAVAARSCQVPFLYVDACTRATDLARLRELCPRLVVSGTIGAGHFHHIQLPAQINATIERFLGLVAAGTVAANV
jgi:pimeloyl-ACP methyl ester carboxylesterase